MARYTYNSIDALRQVGINYDDAVALRRISMTLHRWHEMECGDDNGYASFCLVRGRKTKAGFEHDDDGAPFIESHPHQGNGVRYWSTPDRERGALKRLEKIMSRYPTLGHYVQGDPRGAALYILRPGDVPEGAEADAYYSRGVVVCK